MSYVVGGVSRPGRGGLAPLGRRLRTQSVPVEHVAELIGADVVVPVPVPHDCTDGFCHAWWRRPDAYLDPAVRAGISGIARLPAAVVDEAMARLADDLATGRWHAAHADLAELYEVDAGYRLVVATPTDAHA